MIYTNNKSDIDKEISNCYSLIEEIETKVKALKTLKEDEEDKIRTLTQLVEQYKWERDVALAQLKELGVSLGRKIDGVYLSKEEYDKLLEYKYMYRDLCE